MNLEVRTPQTERGSVTRSSENLQRGWKASERWRIYEVAAGHRPALRIAMLSVIVFLFVLHPALGQTKIWNPAPGPLFTRWAGEVNPTNAHPEYPRPQLTRADWLNLNGLWDYAITPIDAREATDYEGRILVPFPIESALSGVMRRLDENSTLWYRRKFSVPENWRGRRVRLHFGAVDWAARIFINGKSVGRHRGGYDSFTFDITDQLNQKAEQEIVVAVEDPTEGDQPRGKQSRNPEGIFYTPTSGIWQTVWLEPVNELCIDELRLTPDLDAGVLHVRAAVGGMADSLQVEVVALSSNQVVGQVTGLANQELNLPIASPHLWSPEDPFLYDLSITLKDGDRVVDSVGSYFGMRKIALRRDAGGVMRMELNDRFVFEAGALDQGFWPEGIYTAPTDDALRFDIEFLKQSGFNLARKHVKVEPDRWYYWCDRLGLLVWQDMPSGNNNTLEGRTQFEVELQRMIEGRRNHPSIILWILFNEGWGQYDTERLAAWVKALDPSRLVSNASGWTDKRVGDLLDIHSYPGPEAPPTEAQRAGVLGEFGGLGLGWTGHTWSDKFWGYQPMPDQKTLIDRYAKLWDRVYLLRDFFGLNAAVYTQTTDVETECNGLMTYDRAISKIDPAVAVAANTGKSREQPFDAIAPNALYGRVLWEYTTENPGDRWNQPDFDDTSWAEALGGFGTRDTPGSLVNTDWKTPDIWLRRKFNWNGQDLSNARIQIHHDEDAEVYLNGVLAASVTNFVTSYYEVEIAPAARAALKPGVNVMAVHCHQNQGGQYIDAGIVAPRTQ
ncbi:MAG TPA: glycoside hydrolase family 2 TIM barrel-domain containing protein [Verrucomicrobiae bacterium]|nr:glycoside hydrolase family 2 TIM barrel-domain containing protein [Verrucomicrobiae bacterium]